MKTNRFKSRLLTALALVAVTSAAMAQNRPQPPGQSPPQQHRADSDSSAYGPSGASADGSGSGVNAGGGRPPGGGNFNKQKSMELQRLEKRESVEKTLRSCLTAATDHASMKACNEAAHAAMPPRRGGDKHDQSAQSSQSGGGARSANFSRNQADGPPARPTTN